MSPEISATVIGKGILEFVDEEMGYGIISLKKLQEALW